MSEPGPPSEGTPKGQLQPIPLERHQGMLIAGMGLCLMGSGVFAVFATEREAGPVALLGLGMLCFIIGLAGHLPTRLKLLDAELELGKIQDAVKDLVDDVAPTAEPLELMDSLSKLNRALPDVATPAIEGLLYHQSVVRLLQAIATDWNGSTVRVDDRRWDVVMDRGDGTRLVVEIYSGRRGRADVTALLQRFRTNFQDDGLGSTRLLIVSRVKLTSDALAHLSLFSAVSTVVVEGPNDGPALRAEVHRLLGSDAR